MERMDLEELKKTDVWDLYQQSLNYCNMINMFSDTDRNYRFFNGDQWNGVKLKGVEPVQLNFIKPIVRYKTGIVHNNYYAIHFSSQNYDERFRDRAERICQMLNRKASKLWENNYLDAKTREVTKDSAINDEGILYVAYDEENKELKNEVLKKNNVYYCNENDNDIQNQPYILIRKRVPLLNAIEEARQSGVSEERINLIMTDRQVEENSGDASKLEKDDMVTIITKMWKEKGTVWFEKATMLVVLEEPTDTGMKRYPLAHELWDYKEGSARGEGEVRYLIPNQIETNKNFMRSIMVARNTAYPQRVARVDKIQNPNALNEVGGTIKVVGQDVDDVNKIFSIINPAQMSTDVEKLRNELISTTRELANASDTATGQVNPEDASGRAILAVQQASQQPLTEQLMMFKMFVEDIARIWLDMWITYSDGGMELEYVNSNELGEEVVVLDKVTKVELEEIKASIKIDITPKSAYDKYAQEMSIENLLKQGYFNSQRLGELKVYTEALDDDAVMPKIKLEKIVKSMEEEQMKIAQINAQVQMMQQRANNFISSDPDNQASIVNAATQGMDEEAVE